MSADDDKTLDGYIATAATLLELPIEPEWQATIRSNLRATLKLANSVAEFELPDDAEPAPVFRA